MDKQQIVNRVMETIKQTGFSEEEAKHILDEAKKKIEAMSLVGVAGFWS